MSHTLPHRATQRTRYESIARLARRLAAFNRNLPDGIVQALPVWLRQIERRRRQLPEPLLAKLVHQCLQHFPPHASSQQLRTQLRTVARIATAFKDHVTIEGLLTALTTPFEDRNEELRRVQQQAEDRHQRQVASAVKLTEYSEMARRFVEYLSATLNCKSVPVQFDAKPSGVKHLTPELAARTEIRAYTDGAVLHLPPVCAIHGVNDEQCDDKASEVNRELNVMFGIGYLVLHEYLHLAGGSFQFSFTSRRGARLFRLLRPWRFQYRERAQKTMSTRLKEKLIKEGVKPERLEQVRGHDLIRFYQHFANQSLIQFLVNGMEDGRIESVIARRWSGLHQLHQVVDEYYSQNVTTSSHAFTSSHALVNAIAMYAAGRKMHVKLTAPARQCFLQATKLIDRQKRLERQSLYDSLATARKLYLLLEKHFGADLDAPKLGLDFATDVDAEEVSVRLWLTENDEAEKTEELPGRIASDPKYQVRAPGVWLPEWNGRELRERSVYVSVRPFSATKIVAGLTPLTLNFPDLNLQRQSIPGGTERIWKTYGPFLAQERLARFRIHSRAGVFDVPVNYDCQQPALPLKVSLIFDLSISCEAPRIHLNGDSTINKAIQAGIWMASNLEAQGAEVHAYGAVDGGPKSCQLFELPQPVSRSIATLRCVGAGGFRVGAFVRAIARAPAELGLRPTSGRHKVIVLTDGDPGYLSLGAETVFAGLHQNNCPNCTSRHRCRVEHARGGINARSGYEYIYLPKSYDMADLSNAVCDENQSCLVLNFGAGVRLPSVGQLDIENVWTNVASDIDLLVVGPFLNSHNSVLNHFK